MPGPLDALRQLLSAQIGQGELPTPKPIGGYRNQVAPVGGDLGDIAMDSDQMEMDTGATGFWDFAPGYRPGATQRREFGQRPDDIDLPSPAAMQGLQQANVGPMSGLGYSSQPTSEFWVDEATGPRPRFGNMQGRSIRPDRPRDAGGIQGWDMNYMKVPGNMDVYMDDMDRLDAEEAQGRNPYMKYQKLGGRR